MGFTVFGWTEEIIAIRIERLAAAAQTSRLVWMKLVLSLTAFALLAFPENGLAASLDEKSTGAAWASASEAEKEQWMNSFKYKNASIDRTKIAACIDSFPPLPVFETNDLASRTSLCETMIRANADGVGVSIPITKGR